MGQRGRGTRDSATGDVSGEGWSVTRSAGRATWAGVAPEGPPRLHARSRLHGQREQQRERADPVEGGGGYVDPLIRAADRIVDAVVELIREVAAIDAALQRAPDDMALALRRAEAMREIHVLRAYSNYYRLVVARDEAYLRGERPPFRVVCLY
jgi:hypothetical protein